MKARRFVVGARRQQEWNWRIILDLFFSGTGAALFLIAAIMGDLMRMSVGVGIVLIGACFILADLSRPSNAWRAFLRPNKSWVSRGTIGITGFAVIAVIYIAYVASQANSFSSLGAPWSGGEAWLKVFGVVVMAAAIFVASYPGFLLGGMRPVALWNTAYLPALFLVSALVSGLGVIYLIPGNLFAQRGTLAFLQNISIGVIVLGFFLFLSLVLLVHPQTTRDSVKLLTTGPLRLHYFGGVLAIGLVAPLVMLALFFGGVGASWLLPVAGVLLLVGMLILRYIVIKAGIQVSPV